MKRESHLRSVLKGFTWRILATTTTTTIAYLATGSAKLAFTIGGFEFFIKIFIYYLHERAWLLVPPGTIRKTFGKKDHEQ
jgi:uncharacterized membrane protein